MTTTSAETFTVIGATGNQGRAAVDALLESGVAVRALVRDPTGDAAAALRSRGVDVVVADQEDATALRRGLAGTSALFFFTTFDGPDGTDGETRRGVTIAEAAAAAGVGRVVYSSVGGAERHTGIPHFESKRRVEERLEELLPTTFVRPTFFMENLAQQLEPGPTGEIVLRLPLAADLPMQIVSVRDVGRAGARLLVEPEAVRGGAIEIAGDELTPDEMAGVIGEVFEVPARFEPLPLDVLASDADLHAMFSWFATTPSYRADRTGTRALLPDVLDLRAWATLQRARAADAG